MRLCRLNILLIIFQMPVWILLNLDRSINDKIKRHRYMKNDIWYLDRNKLYLRITITTELIGFTIRDTC